MYIHIYVYIYIYTYTHEVPYRGKHGSARSTDVVERQSLDLTRRCLPVVYRRLPAEWKRGEQLNLQK